MPQLSRRNAPRTPRSMSRYGPLARGMAGSLARGAVRGVARAVPGVGPALAAYDVGRSLLGQFRSARRSRTNSQMPKRTKAGFARTMSRKGNKGSASNSKSKGFFGGTADMTSKFDKHARTGVVLKKETGGVRVDPTNSVIYLAQSTAPATVILFGAMASLVKKLFIMNGIDIKSFSSLLLEGQNYPMKITLKYKLRDGSVPVDVSWTVSTTATLDSVTNLIYTTMIAFVGDTVPDQFLKLSLLDDYSGWVGAAPVLRSAIDMTTCAFQYDIKSLLKIQNRTINSTGNNEADDVDNVPIYGKFFDYKTNGTVYQDYTTGAGPSTIATHPEFGVLATTVPVTTGSGMYNELPLQTQFAGCRKSGKSHLDPGEVKTSLITDSFKISFAKLVKTICAKTQVSGTTYTQYWIGKSRLFGWEKMIQAVANNATTQFNLAYEHQLNIGVTPIIKRDLLTAPSTSQITQT